MADKPQRSNAPATGGLPGSLTLNAIATVDVAAAGQAGQARRPTFSAKAYSGGILTGLAGWPRPAVIDLVGLRAAEPLTVFKDHDPAKIVGQSTRVAIGASDVAVDGIITGDGGDAGEVVDHARNGFRWPVSVGVAVERTELVDAGRTAVVNGRQFKGPLVIVRAGVLKEISFVGLGADDNATATIAVQRRGGESTMAVETIINDNGGAGEVEIRKSERHRLANIEAACKDLAGPQVTLLKAQAIDGEITTEQLQAGLLNAIRAARPSAPAIHVSRSPARGEMATILQAAACLTANLGTVEKQYSPQILDAADRYRGIGLRRMCELAAAAEGVELPLVFSRQSGEWLRAAFSTVSIPGILSNTANKFLLDGFAAVEQTWREIAAVRPVNDFKTNTFYRLTSNLEYEEVAKGGELKHGTLGEESYTNRARTYGKLLTVDRQDVVNDDLGSITQAPRNLGRGAGQKLNGIFWTTFLDNAAFFTGALRNYAAGAETALSSAAMDAAEILFARQTAPDGKPLGMLAKKLLVPVELRGVADSYYVSTEIREPGAAGKYPTANTHAKRYPPSTSAYLSNSTLAGYSAKAWYLLADPAELATIEVVFLNGQESPTIETAEADFSVLGIAMRGYHDFGVALAEYRAGVKMLGEAEE